MNRSCRFQTGFIVVYVIFVVCSYVTGYAPGKLIGGTFAGFALYMVKIIPCAFILISLFEVWVRRETVELIFGVRSGWAGHLSAILLAGTTIGGTYVAFPVAVALYGKGARLGVVFTYIGAAAICRIPMTLFEASFMGIKFTLIRLGVSIPLVVCSSVILGKWLEKQGYEPIGEKEVVNLK